MTEKKMINSLTNYLKKNNPKIAKNLDEQIRELCNDPHSKLDKIVNSFLYKTRAGKYRTIIRIDETEKMIHVTRIRPRENSYKKQNL